MNKPTMSLNRERLVPAFFFIAFGFLLYQLFVLARPFFPGLFGACLLALAFYPLYIKVNKRTKKPSVAAFILTVSVVLLAVLPILYAAIVVIDEAGKLAPTSSSVAGKASGSHLAARACSICCRAADWAAAE